jgi:peptidoglycan hydrolase-like protein with peptidoglycan-binding domain
LLLPVGRFGPAFLAYDNFKIYRIWNASLVYASTAAYYATRLGGAAPMRMPSAPIPSLGHEQTRELQHLLVQRGFDVGKVDGILGAQSRAAVKAVQKQYGFPADSWPTAELLERLRRR